MPWFKVDDSFPTHPKVRRIPRGVRMSAVGVWTACGCWSAHHLTDGRVTLDNVEDEGGKAGDAKALVAAGLWHEPGHACDRCPQPGDGEYQYHDWREWQPAREDVQARRAEDAKRKAEWRAKRNAERETERQAREVQNASRPEDVTAGQPRDGQRDTPVTPASVTTESRLTRPGPDPTRTRPVPGLPTGVQNHSGHLGVVGDTRSTPNEVSIGQCVAAHTRGWSRANDGALPSDHQSTQVSESVRKALTSNPPHLVLAGAERAGELGVTFVDRGIGEIAKERATAGRAASIPRPVGQSAWDLPPAPNGLSGATDD